MVEALVARPPRAPAEGSCEVVAFAAAAAAAFAISCVMKPPGRAGLLVADDLWKRAGVGAAAGQQCVAVAAFAEAAPRKAGRPRSWSVGSCSILADSHRGEAAARGDAIGGGALDEQATTAEDAPAAADAADAADVPEAPRDSSVLLCGRAVLLPPVPAWPRGESRPRAVRAAALVSRAVSTWALLVAMARPFGRARGASVLPAGGGAADGGAAVVGGGLARPSLADTGVDRPLPEGKALLLLLLLLLDALRAVARAVLPPPLLLPLGESRPRAVRAAPALSDEAAAVRACALSMAMVRPLGKPALGPAVVACGGGAADGAAAA